MGRAAAVVSRLRRRSSIAALGLRRVGAAAPVLHRILRAVAAPAVPLPAAEHRVRLLLLHGIRGLHLVLHPVLRAVAAAAVALPAVAAAAAAVAPLARDVVAEAAHLAAVAQPLLEVEADAAPAVGRSWGERRRRWESAAAGRVRAARTSWGNERGGGGAVSGAAEAAGRVGARAPPVGAAAAVDLRPPRHLLGARLAAPLVEDLNIFHLRAVLQRVAVADRRVVAEELLRGRERRGERRA